MPAQIVDGTRLAGQIKETIALRVKELEANGQPVHLAALLIGGSHAAEIYAQRQGESCRALGIGYTLHVLPPRVDMQTTKQVIRALNEDPRVTGIMMHLPVPDTLNATRLQYEIDVVKDVEGVAPANIGYVVYGKTLIAPCTALAVIEMIKSTGVELRGAEAVVVGASEIAGKPISLLLTEQMATVTTCHIDTRDVASHTRRADIVVVAVGKPGLITADHIRQGAIVIDVGINRVTQPDGTKRTVGDVAFESVSQKAGFVSPVPGGVGPMTVAMLLKNTLRSAEIMYGYEKR